MIKLIEKQNIIIEDKETLMKRIEDKNKPKPIFFEDQKKEKTEPKQTKQPQKTT